MRIDRPEHYYDVRLERSRQASDVYEEGASFALSMYVSGLAVESMLRALALRKNPAISEQSEALRMFKGHDINLWFNASALGDADPESLETRGLSEVSAEAQFVKIRAAINDVCLLWSNLHRFASEDVMRKQLKRMRHDRGIQGSFLKENARRLLSASQFIITAGDQRWKSLEKSKPS